MFYAGINEHIVCVPFGFTVLTGLPGYGILILSSVDPLYCSINYITDQKGVNMSNIANKEDKLKALDAAIANIEKEFGKGSVMKLGDADETMEDAAGICHGLAWTQAGGTTLQIEVNTAPGKGELLLTGQLGDVMKESARAGISYIRSIAGEYRIPDEWFSSHDIHIHIPEGAVPKDGPSAGITMASAMLSAITGIKLRGSVAMTGEITLRGRVLPIGGLKEKLLAAAKQ